MNEIEKDFTLKTLVTFKIIPFDDELWRTVFPQLKEQFGIEQINIVESRLYLSAFKHYYDVYVDKALIDKYGTEVINEMVREKIKERIDKEMERDLGFLNTKKQSLAKDDWKMQCPYKDGDEYWFIYSSGGVDSSFWVGRWEDDSRLKLGNAFPTEEAAELEAKRRNLLTRFRAFRDECNGDYKADFENPTEEKFSICFYYKKFRIQTTYNANDFATFGYFKNKEDAQRAIELFGDEIIELYVNNEV